METSEKNIETSEKSDKNIESSKNETETENENEIKHTELRYGDFIRIIAPENKRIDQHIFFIDKITTDQILLIDTADLDYPESYLLRIQDGVIQDNTIRTIEVISRSDNLGYVLQNGLTSGKTVNIRFTNPAIPPLQVVILSTEKDSMEGETIDTKKPVFIDFAYEGLPDFIESIEVIEPGEEPSFASLEREATVRSREGEQGQAFMSLIPVESEDDKEIDQLCVEGDDAMRNFVKLEDIVEDFDEVQFMVEVSENRKRYHFETQIQDMIQTYYQNMSAMEQTPKDNFEIQRQIERFIELRNETSQFEINGIITKRRINPKPLIAVLTSQTKLERFPCKDSYRWFVPVVSARRNFFDLPDNVVTDDTQVNKIEDFQREIGDVWEKYTNDNQEGSQSKYFAMTNRLIRPSPFEKNPGSDAYQQPVLCSSQKVLLTSSTRQQELTFPALHYHDKSMRVYNKSGYTTRFVGPTPYYNAKQSKNRKKSVAAASVEPMEEKFIMPMETMTIDSVVIQPLEVIQGSRCHLPGTSLSERISLQTTSKGMPEYLPSKHWVLNEIDSGCGLFTRNAKTYHDCKESDKKATLETGEVEDADLGETAVLQQSKPITANPATKGSAKPTGAVEWSKDSMHFSYKNRIKTKEEWSEFVGSVLPDAEYFLQELQKLPHVAAQATHYPAVMKLLEPIGIYSDNITYSTYKYIKIFIEKNIRQHLSELRLNREQMRDMIEPIRNYYKEYMPNTIRQLFATTDGTSLVDTLERAYEYKTTAMRLLASKVPYDAMSNTEIMATMNYDDYSDLFAIVLRYLHLRWTLPENLYTPPQIEELEDAKTAAKYKKSRGANLEFCNKVIAKRYLSEDALQKDNGEGTKPMYDEGRDLETNYDDAELLETDSGKTATTRAEKLDFLTQALTAKYNNINQDKDSEEEKQRMEKMATAILDRKRPIENGDYAVLEMRQVVFAEDENRFRPRKQEIVTERIYKRVNNVWRWQQNMTMEEFQTTEELVKQAKDPSRKDVVKQELGRRYQVSIEALKLHLDAEMKELSAAMKRKKRVVMQRKLLQNDLLYGIAMKVAKDAEENALKGIGPNKSPYLPLRDEILAIKDDYQRNHALLQFYAFACRAAVAEENPSWAYCKDTNTRLLPVCFHELSKAYFAGNYSKRIGELCRQYGTIDETGGSWIDRESGIPICLIEQVGENMSENEMFKEMANAEIDHQQFIETLFENTLTEHADILGGKDQVSVANIVYRFLVKQTGIQADDTLMQRFRNGLSKLLENPKVFVQKETYERMLEKKRAKLDPGQPMTDPPFDIYQDKVVITASTVAFFFVVQTAIPEPKRANKKAGPVECHYSFDGWPLTAADPDDDVGMRYIACLINSNKVDSRPWNAIQKVSLQGMVNNLKAYMKYFLLDATLLDALEVKRRYAGLEGAKKIGSETKLVGRIEREKQVDIQKWQHFLPPVVKFSVADKLHDEPQALANLVADYEQQTKTVTSSRSGQKRHALLRLSSLLLLFAYGFVESVNKIVKGRQVRLKTQSQVPYLENACCDEATGCERVIDYMSASDAALKKWVTLSKEIDDRLQGVVDVLRAPFLFYLRTPQFPVDVVIRDSTVENRKLALIHYLYDLKGYDDPDYRLIVQVTTPTAEYYRSVTMKDKVAYFERENANLVTPDLAVFTKFMQQVSAKNRINIKEIVRLEEAVDQQYKEFNESLQLLQEVDEDRQIFDALAAFLEGGGPNAASSTAAENQQQQQQQQQEVGQRQAFKVTNPRALESLLLSKRKKMVADFLTNYQFSIAAKPFETGVDIMIQQQYYCNQVYYLLRFYPRMVLRKYAEKFWPGKHWGFSDHHNDTLEEKIEALSNAFRPFRHDPTVTKLLERFMEKTEVLWQWFQKIPISRIPASTLTQLYAFITVDIYYKYMEVLNEMATEAVAPVRSVEEEREDADEDDLDMVVQNVHLSEEELLERSLQENTALMASIKISQKRDMQDKLVEYLKACLKEEQARFDLVNVTYDQVIEKTRIYSNKEKDSIKAMFGKKDLEGQRVEKMMKKFKLGRWNVGDEIFKYKKDAFDKEMENQDLNHLYEDDAANMAFVTGGVDLEENTFGDMEGKLQRLNPEEEDGNDVAEEYEYDGEEENGDEDLEDDYDDDYM